MGCLSAGSQSEASWRFSTLHMSPSRKGHTNGGLFGVALAVWSREISLCKASCRCMQSIPVVLLHDFLN
ncbi:hypothetical protein EUGRSUZ_J02219 [Eucalyptus grandis]|uniref:Uncharacterized protein n=2 Tax=Eucalyptus grandis TaxID=71139 RepID=A0ACC3J9Q0_EUCGR|nr:hypothetical protein EUGRSUZ_J02219 [Eucalyptus grandis]